MYKIAYSGIEGCFAYMAARRLFPDELHVPFENFKKAYEAVVRAECDRAVLPITNSYAGEVKEVQELLKKGDLRIVDTYPFPVVQNLVGLRGSRIGDVKTVISQTKALEQCEPYIRSHGYRTVTSTNTAVAAQEVIDRQDMSFAAIASLETAARYGLKVLDEKINEADDNITTFAVVSRA
ncbi:MAG: hypothetical protein K5641_04275 [Lachnospiraceae bacterium]|nr:hypothetical protein [Lachnospiraceae bacterium]